MAKIFKVLVLNGPNLNLLGTREPSIYGANSLEEINTNLVALSQKMSLEIDFFQSNYEGELITKVHNSQDYDFLIINPAGYTHTSIAWRDALLATKIPFVEVHLSNIFARETFRHHSYFSDIAIGTICGLGAKGYELALMYAVDHLRRI